MQASDELDARFNSKPTTIKFPAVFDENGVVCIATPCANAATRTVAQDAQVGDPPLAGINRCFPTVLFCIPSKGSRASRMPLMIVFFISMSPRRST